MPANDWRMKSTASGLLPSFGSHEVGHKWLTSLPMRRRDPDINQGLPLPDPEYDSLGGRVDPKAPDSRSVRLRWWMEAVYVGLFYAIYTGIRNTQGSARVGVEHAFTNAKRIVGMERAIAIYHEERIQQAFLNTRGFMRGLNIFYGTGHFIVTLAALIWTYLHLPARYPRMRNTLLLTTGLALFGFALFPLMPPRLMPHSYGFVDGLARYGGSWSFDSGAMAKISNQYAAMPSLHFGWSAWCTISFWPWALNGRWWRKALLVGYPILTTMTIVITGNHFFLDALGGGVVLFVGYRMALWLARTRWLDWWRARAVAPSAYPRSGS
jgi:hypothetical protein